MLKKKKKEDPEVHAMDDNNQGIEPEANQENAEIDSAPPAEELLKEELGLANDKYVRLYAEFDNFRRRTIKEREDARKTEGKDLIVSLLPVLDDFERALRSMETTGDVASLKEGVQLIQQKLKNTLTQKGLKEMESIGTAFDPEVHEAITNIPAPADDMKGKVMDEMEKGYLLNDKVIRFAKVVVGA